MSVMVPLALFGWPILTIAGFVLMRPRIAVIVAYVVGFLFLPVYRYDLPLIPDYDKVAATNIGALLGVLAFDLGRVLTFRLRPLDLVVVAWMAAPALADYANDLGLYSGAAAILRSFITWGIPWLIGRLYFSNVDGLRALAFGVIAGGLVYVPLCLWEVRMSPQLHHKLYGFHQHAFGQSVRGDSYRPMVFLEHGLMLGMWMTMATLFAAIVLWTRAAPARLQKLWPWLTLALAGTTVLCRSMGALILLIAGVVAFQEAKRMRRARLAWAMVLVPPLYVVLRLTGAFTGDALVEFIESINPERAESLAYRQSAEKVFIAHAMKSPWFGWGGYGRMFPPIEEGADEFAIDGLWIIAFGSSGYYGVTTLLLTLLAPVVVFLRNCPARFFAVVPHTFAAMFALVLLLNAIDCLPNAMIDPIFILGLGGLAGISASVPRADVTMPVACIR